MFKILGKNARKSIALIIVFYGISIIFSFGTSVVMSYTRALSSNALFTSNSYSKISFTNEGNKEITKDEFINSIAMQSNLILSKHISMENNDGSNINGQALYFNKSCNKNPPILEGEFLKRNNFKTKEPVAVIGKSLIDNIKLIDNQKFITSEGVNYKVIGIMGYKNKKSEYDDTFVVNLNSSIDKFQGKIEDYLRSSLLIVDGYNISSDKAIADLYNTIKSFNGQVVVNIDEKSNHYGALTQSFVLLKPIITIGVVLVLVLFSNVVNATYFWIEEKRKEIGVRKAVGATNIDIIKRIMFQYQVMAIIASGLALITHAFLNKFTHVLDYFGGSIISISMYSSNVFILIIVAVVVGLVTAMIPISQLLKMDASTIIRGR